MPGKLQSRLLFLEENGVNRSIQSEMDKMPDVYTKNLLMKNISMVEYMDFMDSYHASKEVLLRSRKELRLQFERLTICNRTNYKITNDEENNLSFTTVAASCGENSRSSCRPGNRFGRFFAGSADSKSRVEAVAEGVYPCRKIVVDSDRTISYSPLVSGVVVKSYFSLGDYAEKGKRMVDIRSVELSSLQSELAVARQNLKGVESLHDERDGNR